MLITLLADIRTTTRGSAPIESARIDLSLGNVRSEARVELPGSWRTEDATYSITDTPSFSIEVAHPQPGGVYNANSTRDLYGPFAIREITRAHFRQNRVVHGYKIENQSTVNLDHFVGNATHGLVGYPPYTWWNSFLAVDLGDLVPAGTSALAHYLLEGIDPSDTATVNARLGSIGLGFDPSPGRDDLISTFAPGTPGTGTTQIGTVVGDFSYVEKNIGLLQSYDAKRERAVHVNVSGLTVVDSIPQPQTLVLENALVSRFTGDDTYILPAPAATWRQAELAAHLYVLRQEEIARDVKIKTSYDGEIRPGTWVTLSGEDGFTLRVLRVIHELGGAGYTTTVEGRLRNPRLGRLNELSFDATTDVRLPRWWDDDAIAPDDS